MNWVVTVSESGVLSMLLLFLGVVGSGVMGGLGGLGCCDEWLDLWWW